MNDYRNVLERDLARVGPAPFDLDDVARRRDRKRRNQRIAAGVVGVAVFVAAVWIVTSVGSLDRSETSVVPGRDVTGPAETGPAETGPAETTVENPEPAPMAEPVQIGTVTRSGAGCALESVAEPIPAGAGRLTVVNETNRRVLFELFRLASEASFARFEAFVADAEDWDIFAFGASGRPPLSSYGTFLWAHRAVAPGASGTITDNFTTGDAFAVVCLDDDSPGGSHLDPFAVVGPIVMP